MALQMLPGIWWPNDSVSLKVTSPLPKQLKILYVPELVSEKSYEK